MTEIVFDSRKVVENVAVGGAKLSHSDKSTTTRTLLYSLLTSQFETYGTYTLLVYESLKNGNQIDESVNMRGICLQSQV